MRNLRAPSSLLIRLIVVGVGLLLIANGCGGVPTIITSDSNNLNNPLSDPARDHTTNPPTNCTDSVRTQIVNFRPESTRGANIVFALDDSGSMSQEINRVKDNMGSFITQLKQDTADNYRIVLIFSPSGTSGNGSALNGVNPFTSQIDNQKVFFVNEGTGSRGADIAIFKAFSLPEFQQVLPTSVPTDVFGVNQSSCMGSGKYYRPRDQFAPLAGSDDANRCGVNVSCDSGNTQTPSACYVAGTKSNRNAQNQITGPLSYLIPGVSINLITLSDDNLNIAGDFSNASGNGLDLLKKMYEKVFEPLGSESPTYFHSVVGLTDNSAPPADYLGVVERIGSEHLAMTNLTGGLSADIRQSSYNSVFQNLRTKIVLSEQVFTLACSLSNPSSVQVKLNGVALSPSLYQIQANSTELRLLPGAIDPSLIGTVIQLEIIYQ